MNSEVDYTYSKISTEQYLPDGKALFQENCASCHHPLKTETGPALKYISDNRTKEWIYKFVVARKQLKGDSILKSVRKSNEEFDCLDFPNLSKEEVEAIFNYAPGCSGLPKNSK